MRNAGITILALLALCEAAAAVQILEPGYVAETYVTYSSGPEKPREMTSDDNGNLYISQLCDSGGSIVRINTGKQASQLVSGLDRPAGIVWAGGTNYGDYLYVVRYETWGGGVWKVGLDGTISNFATMISGGHAPSPIGLDRTGNYGGYLYVGSTGQDHTYCVDTTGNVTMFSNFPGWLDGGGPGDIAFDTVGNYGGAMFVSTSFVGVNQDKSGLFTLDTSGTATRLTTDLVTAKHIAFDETGLLGGGMFVVGKSDFNDSWSIWLVAPDSTATEFARTTISDPYGLTFGSDGAMYIAEYSSANETIVISRVIPEPATILLLSLGGIMLRRKR